MKSFKPIQRKALDKAFSFVDGLNSLEEKDFVKFHSLLYEALTESLSWLPKDGDSWKVGKSDSKRLADYLSIENKLPEKITLNGMRVWHESFKTKQALILRLKEEADKREKA